MAFCPKCGADLTRDEVRELGPFLFDPRGPVLYNGERLHISPTLHILLGSLVYAYPRIVREETLCERLDGHSALLRVHITRLRRIVPNGKRHIVNEHSTGYRLVL